MDKNVTEFMNRVKKDIDFNRVKFVILFGSRASDNFNNMSDYDFAVYFDGDKKERFAFRKRMLGNLDELFDVVIFQDLPLYIQKEVLKGKLIFFDELNFVYQVAHNTIKNYGNFKKYYYDYIGMEKIT